MITQTDPQLSLFTAPPPPENLAWFERQLLDARGWLTARALLTLAAKVDTDANRRWLRRMAEASQVTLSGQHGYRHLDHATPDEVHHFVAWMESQGKKMLARAEHLRRRAHTRVG